MPPDPRVHVGVAGWLEEEGDVLLQKRHPSVSHGGDTWSVPGGWVDYGETTKQAIEREFLEECDLKVKAHEVIDVVSNTWEKVGHVICVFHRVELLSGRPRLVEPDKHVAVGWMDIDTLYEELPLFAPLATLLGKE